MSTILVQELSRDTFSGDELISLLGPPDIYVSQTQWRYRLRKKFALFFPDNYWLHVLVIPAGDVTEARVIAG
jgi:hypothetical protein